MQDFWLNICINAKKAVLLQCNLDSDEDKTPYILLFLRLYACASSGFQRTSD